MQQVGQSRKIDRVEVMSFVTVDNMTTITQSELSALPHLSFYSLS